MEESSTIATSVENNFNQNKVIKIEDDSPTEDGSVKKRKRGRIEIEIDLKLKDESYSITDDGNVIRKYKTRERRAPPPQKLEGTKPIAKIPLSTDFICDVCHHCFMTPQALIRHRISHDKKTHYKCAVCSSTFDTNPELIKHKSVHQDEDRQYRCPNCKENFTDHLNFVVHKLRHSKSKSLNCAECGRHGFRSKRGFRIHIETHYNNVVECEICHRMIKTFQIKAHMYNHKAAKKPNTAKPCVECGKMYKPKELENHMYIHTGVRPFQCLYCGKGFVRSQARITHMRIHTQERPYKCRFCDRTFKQHTDKMRHEERHEGKMYGCDVCGKQFTNEYMLKAHKSIHNNTQKYHCKLCTKKFHILPSLKSHMAREHLNLPEVKCEPCGRSYKLIEYKKHLKSIKHRNNVFGANAELEDIHC